ncbi:unnamed protein product [Urochloa decumbens]|uniref:FBD domain-containing protein n=1 Tax=Urochloa decumbens TaxID=240449 RepID=A0ABC8YYC7_9POAL
MGVVNRAQAKRRRSGGPDLISRLPDEILGSIISLLPTEQGARTQILSSRWRPLWRSAPLNLEPYGLASGINEDVVSRILTEHRGGARRFKAPPHILHGDPATLDRWLRSPVLNDLQELRLYFPPFALPMRTIPRSAMRFSSTLRIAHFSCCQFTVDAAHRLHFPNLQLLSLLSVSISDDCLHAVLASCPALDKFQLVYCYYISPKPLMPPSTLRFSSTLRVARFGHCQFPDAAALKVHFSNLQYLELRMVTVSERSLHAMLSSCPALNNLILTANFGFRKFMINSLKLKRVEMCFGRSDTEIELEELIVVNAPCLEILDQRGPYVWMAILPADSGASVLAPRVLGRRQRNGPAAGGGAATIPRAVAPQPAAAARRPAGGAAPRRQRLLGRRGSAGASVLRIVALEGGSGCSARPSGQQQRGPAAGCRLHSAHATTPLRLTPRPHQTSHRVTGCPLPADTHRVRARAGNFTRNPSRARAKNEGAVSAPKLKILARLNDNTSRLELGTTVFEGRHALSVATTMCSVKVLALKLHSLSLHMAINFMKCFPCLEKLYIKTRISTENVELHNSLDRNECLDFHLKKLRIRHYSGKRSHLAFARFFVLNASVLESLVLIVDPEMEESDSWIENQRRKLQLEKRASIGCEIKFSSVGDSSYHSDIQDLSEPFE